MSTTNYITPKGAAISKLIIIFVTVGFVVWIIWTAFSAERAPDLIEKTPSADGMIQVKCIQGFVVLTANSSMLQLINENGHGVKCSIKQQK